MKKNILFLVVLGAIIIVLAGVIIFWPKPAKTNPPQPQKPAVVEGMQVLLPKEGAAISSPLKITGVVNGGGWSGFEGQVGTVELLDYKGNKLATAVLTAKTEWTKPEISFETTLTFDNKTPGPATLLFKNENPSGLPDKDKLFGLSVVIK